MLRVLFIFMLSKDSLQLVKGAITLKSPVIFGITPKIVTLDDMPT